MLRFSFFSRGVFSCINHVISSFNFAFGVLAVATLSFAKISGKIILSIYLVYTSSAYPVACSGFGEREMTLINIIAGLSLW